MDSARRDRSKTIWQVSAILKEVAIGNRTVVVHKEPEPTQESLLATAGLTQTQWDTYLTILKRPSVTIDELASVTPEVLASMQDLGLLRPSLERTLGYAPLPPGTAFSRLMTRHDEELLRSMRTGLQLRALMRGVTEATAGDSGPQASGVEVYEDIEQARDRSYELTLRNPMRKQYSIETILRPIEGDSPDQKKYLNNAARATASATLASEAINEHRLRVVIADRTLNAASDLDQYLSGLQGCGQTILNFPGILEQMQFREGTFLVLWKDPFPSRSATLVVTADWALRMAASYVRLLVPLCHPRVIIGNKGTESNLNRVTDLLMRGLTDEQIASRLRVSIRTVGRLVAQLLTDLGAGTRFEAGVLLERRRQLSLSVGSGNTA